MKVYTYKNCGSCKKATKWLNAQGLVYQEIPIRETPPSPAQLEQMLVHQAGDLRKLFNTAGGDYRELNMKERLPQMTQSAAIALLAGRGNLIKRPFLLTDSLGLVGFKQELWESALI